MRQGCILSPFLFNLYAGMIMRKSDPGWSMVGDYHGLNLSGKREKRPPEIIMQHYFNNSNYPLTHNVDIFPSKCSYTQRKCSRLYLLLLNSIHCNSTCTVSSGFSSHLLFPKYKSKEMASLRNISLDWKF